MSWPLPAPNPHFSLPIVCIYLVVYVKHKCSLRIMFIENQQAPLLNVFLDSASVRRAEICISDRLPKRLLMLLVNGPHLSREAIIWLYFLWQHQNSIHMHVLLWIWMFWWEEVVMNRLLTRISLRVRVQQRRYRNKWDWEKQYCCHLFHLLLSRVMIGTLKSTRYSFPPFGVILVSNFEARSIKNLSRWKHFACRHFHLPYHSALSPQNTCNYFILLS